MGNSSLEKNNTDLDKFIKPIKIQAKAGEESQIPLGDITNQIEQVFGITHIPVSHRALLAISSARSLQFSPRQTVNKKRDKFYDQRISNLENQIVYLKSLIEESKYRSRRDSPVRSQMEHQQSSQIQQSGQIQQSISRLSRTYFESRTQQITLQREQ